MIHFQTLGSLDLRDGRPPGGYDEILSRHKRIALLAYLAIEHSGRFCRRDTLLAMFWPEHDAGGARNALSQALHVLRRLLGADVIVNRGQEEVGVDPLRIACDAAEVRMLVEAGRLEEAVAKYTGDLLPGFFVADAPEFERWLESQRGALRAMVANAASQLASDREAAGDLRAAISFAQRAASLVPNDEAALRRLMVLLDASGNRAAALGTYDAFARRFADEMELEPTPETRALAEQMRSRAQRVADPDVEARPRRRAPANETKPAARPRPALRWYGTAAVAIVTFALLAAAAKNWRSAATRPRSVAVLPFVVRGDSAERYLGDGVADLLSAQLADGRAVRSADAQAVLALAHAASGTSATPAVAADIARRVGADGFVLGSVVDIGGRVQVDASLYNMNGEVAARAQAGPVDAHDVFDLIDGLSARLFSERAGARGSDLARVAEATTGSLPALTAFLEGETDFRAGRFEDAETAFHRAIAADSAFALAQYRLAMTAIWTGSNPREPMAAAKRNAARLPAHQRALVDAGLAWLAGENTRAERGYRAVVAEYPDDVEAWNQLVEIQFHTNAARGRDPLEAGEALRHVLQLDPQNADALWHLALLHAQQRGTFDSLTRLALSLGPGSEHSLDIRALRATLIGTADERADVARELAATRPIFVEVVALRAAVFAGDLRHAREVMTNPTFQRNTATRAIAALRRARYDEGAGRVADARRDVAELRPLHFGTYAQERAWLDLLPQSAPTTDELRAAIADVMAWDATHDRGLGDYTATEQLFYDASRFSVLARLFGRLGDWAAADRYVDSLRALASGDRASLIDAMAHNARAFVLADRHEPVAALAQLDSGYREVWYGWAGESAPHAQAAERFLRADLLDNLGRDDEALRWYATAERNSLDDVSYLAPSHDRRARIYERHGRINEARGERESVARLWGDSTSTR